MPVGRAANSKAVPSVPATQPYGSEQKKMHGVPTGRFDPLFVTNIILVSDEPMFSV
jgi:hypothetical protein